MLGLFVYILYHIMFTFLFKMFRCIPSMAAFGSLASTAFHRSWGNSKAAAPISRASAACKNPLSGEEVVKPVKRTNRFLESKLRKKNKLKS